MKIIFTESQGDAGRWRWFIHERVYTRIRDMKANEPNYTDRFVASGPVAGFECQHDAVLHRKRMVKALQKPWWRRFNKDG